MTSTRTTCIDCNNSMIIVKKIAKKKRMRVWNTSSCPICGLAFGGVIPTRAEKKVAKNKAREDKLTKEIVYLGLDTKKHRKHLKKWGGL